MLLQIVQRSFKEYKNTQVIHKYYTILCEEIDHLLILELLQCPEPTVHGTKLRGIYTICVQVSAIDVISRLLNFVTYYVNKHLRSSQTEGIARGQMSDYLFHWVEGSEYQPIKKNAQLEPPNQQGWISRGLLQHRMKLISLNQFTHPCFTHDMKNAGAFIRQVLLVIPSCLRVSWHTLKELTSKQ